MGVRNRAEGWKYAKLTGHENERSLAEQTQEDAAIRQRLLDCAHLSEVSVTGVQYGGLYETDVPCVLGGKTKSKTDLWLELSNGGRLNVSIKKDPDGQVFLIGIDRFLAGFEQQYQIKIDHQVRRAISLYFGSAADTLDVLQSIGSASALEFRKHRLVAKSLRRYDETLYHLLLSWVNINRAELFDFCFSKGLAKCPEDWADIVWYKNTIEAHSFDRMIYLPDLAVRMPATATYGPRNGGSTIQLPFGFVQWHSPRKVIPGQIQFHHSYQKLTAIAAQKQSTE